MSVLSARDDRRPFYGWVVVAAVFVILAMVAGLGFYNASVILRHAKDELGVSVTAVSGATAVFFGVSGLAAFAMSRTMDRVDLRWFYAAGSVLGAASLTGLRWVDSVVHLYVFFFVFGLAFAAAGLVPSMTLVARWFDRRRSVAISVASTGLSLGGIVITPLAAGIIDEHTLAGAGPWLGLAWLLGVAPIALLFVRSWPSEMGLAPDGAPVPDQPIPASGATFRQAVSTRFFRYLSATYALIFMAQVGAIAHLFNLASERVDTATGTAALSTMALTSVVGRLAGGLVVTRVPTRNMTGLMALVQGVALILMASADSRGALLTASAVLGLSIGNLLMLQPLLLVETFGVKTYSSVYAFCQLFGTIGVAGGPFLIGLLRDLQGYESALFIAAGLNVAGFITLMAAGPGDKARAHWETESAAQVQLRASS